MKESFLASTSQKLVFIHKDVNSSFLVAGDHVRRLVLGNMILLHIHYFYVPHQFSVPAEHARKYVRVGDELLDVFPVRLQAPALAPCGVHALVVVPLVERNHMAREPPTESLRPVMHAFKIEICYFEHLVDSAAPAAV